MACYAPLHGYRSRTAHPVTGGRSIVFNPTDGYADRPVTVPCGQCIGCRLERSRQWAIRCYHEASLYDRNAFITLTYDEDNLPADGSVDVREFQLFLKRLRYHKGPGIRFFHCGEYGERYGRPHYHACLFNCDFPDRKLWKIQNNVPLYTSTELAALWEFKGFCSVGEVTFESAAYVARYIMKKITGEAAADHYMGRKPEYTTMSRRPGIGQGWLSKYRSDVYPSDGVVVRGREMRPPKYYDRLYEVCDSRSYKDMRAKRITRARCHTDNNTSSRLRVRETVQKARIERLPRNLDSGD